MIILYIDIEMMDCV